ncbi:MAG: helix-turn-helix transcriptional regulator [Thalassobaculaceae bacterium]|nr:helix-turn-helix transcriptional regulator [Thalassobaculaceae bacterium]
MPNLERPDAIGFALTYRSGTAIAAHTHPAHQLIHAISGAMRVVAADNVWFLPLGRALWIPADTEHEIQCDGQVGMRTAYLSRACAEVFADVRMISVSPLLREALVRLAQREDASLEPLLRDVLLHEIARGSMTPFRLPHPGDRRIAELVRHLHANPAERRTMAEWAVRLGLSDRSMIRSIRAETGMTFRELRRHARIMVAIEKLSEGRQITPVAYDVGFETPSAFAHAFRVVTGMTPRQFVADARASARAS